MHTRSPLLLTRGSVFSRSSMILRNRATQFPTIRARASLHEFHRPIFFLGNLLDIASQTFQRFFRSTIGHCLNFKIEGGKMEEIGKERGTFRKGSRQDLDFQATLCVLFYELSKLGEREGGLKL